MVDASNTVQCLQYFLLNLIFLHINDLTNVLNHQKCIFFFQFQVDCQNYIWVLVQINYHHPEPKCNFNNKIHDSIFNLTKLYMQLETPQEQISNVYTNLFQVDCQNYIRVLVQLDSHHSDMIIISNQLFFIYIQALNSISVHFLPQS